MPESTQQYPEWREYPSAVAETIFYVDDGDSAPPGRARYHSGPVELTEPALRAKGDFVPDYDYAVVAPMVSEDLYEALHQHLDPASFENGTILLRFVATNPRDKWQLETRYDDVERAIGAAQFPTLDVKSDLPTPTSESPFEGLLANIEDADEETKREIRRELER